jgi:subtilisin family serine protease
VVVAAEPAEPDAESAFPTAIPDVLRVKAAVAGAAAPHRPRIEAPGTDVLTTFPRGTYNFISGSSFAAAHISGVVALMLQVQPELSGGEVRTVLADAHGNIAGTAVQQTAVVSACEAIKRLRADAACSDVPVGSAGRLQPRPFEAAARAVAKSSS